MTPAPARAALLVAGLLAWASLPPLAPPVGPAAPPEPPPRGAAGLLYGSPLDLNRASAVDLEVLPGIGPARAQAIVASRAEGPFCRVAELVRVPGIGPVTLERVAAQLAVTAGACAAR